MIEDIKHALKAGKRYHGENWSIMKAEDKYMFDLYDHEVAQSIMTYTVDDSVTLKNAAELFFKAAEEYLTRQIEGITLQKENILFDMKVVKGS